MKANSSVKPPDFYYYENPRNRSKIVIKFCKNIKKGKVGFDYDEYEIEIDKVNKADEYIKNHYNELFYEAKEGPSVIQHLMAKVDYLTMMIEA